jgi:dolichyl-phosphate beta-glucosyltransferase
MTPTWKSALQWAFQRRRRVGSGTEYGPSRPGRDAPPGVPPTCTVSGDSGSVLEVVQPLVSLVIPVYNGESFVAGSLGRARASLETAGIDGEIIAVDDGSTDSTGEILEACSGDRVTTVRLPDNRGKFAAVKAGMSAARGACRIFTDADLPYDLRAIPTMVALLTDGGFHIVVGDRTLPESEIEVDQPLLRRLGTRLFSFSVRMLVTGELFDTQVGLKGFRGDVAAALFPLITDDGFAGDVELLYIALKYNLAIRRIPVRLRRSGPSTVSLVGHSPLMLRRISGLRRRWASGRYDSRDLETIARQRYWDTDDD